MKKKAEKIIKKVKKEDIGAKTGFQWLKKLWENKAFRTGVMKKIGIPADRISFWEHYLILEIEKDGRSEEQTPISHEELLYWLDDGIITEAPGYSVGYFFIPYNRITKASIHLEERYTREEEEDDEF